MNAHTLLLVAAGALLLHAPVVAQSLPQPWKVVETASFGADELDITEIGSAILRPDGVLVLSQPNDRLLVMVEPRGRSITRFGRPGEGPGEFKQIRNLGLVRGQIWVSDMQLRRVTLFDNGARPARSFAIPISLLTDSRNSFSGTYIPLALYDDGSMLLQSAVPQAGPRATWHSGGTAGDMVFVVAGSDGEFQHLIARIPQSSCTRSTPYRNATANLPLPLCAWPMIAVAPNGLTVTTVVKAPIGPPGEFAVVSFDASGKERFRRTVRVSPAPVSRQVADSIRDVFKGRLRDPELVAGFNSLPMPSHFPPFRRAIVGSDGRTWVEISDASPGVQWLVLNASGAITGRVALPRAATVIAADATMMWASVTDNDGLLALVQYRLPGRQ